MKQVFAFVCLLVVLVSAMAVAQDAQAPWRFYLKADSGSGNNFMAAASIGVAADAKDGFGVDGVASDNQDSAPNWLVGPGTRGVLGVFNNTPYVRDIKSLRSPFDVAYSAGQPSLNGATAGVTPNYEANTRIWDLRVFSTPDPQNVAGSTIRLQFLTTDSALLPAVTAKNAAGQSWPCTYTLRMVNNKGVAGAPANGMTWNIPIPTAHSADAYFTLTLPALYLQGATSPFAVADGYQMQVVQSVPEPGSIVAALSLLAPAGLMFRRRKTTK